MQASVTVRGAHAAWLEVAQRLGDAALKPPIPLTRLEVGVDRLLDQSAEFDMGGAYFDRISWANAQRIEVAGGFRI